MAGVELNINIVYTWIKYQQRADKMTIKEERKKLAKELDAAQEKITELALAGLDVGDKDVDDAISEAKRLRATLNRLKNY